MNKKKVKTILMKSLLKETVDLERLRQNVSGRTMLGEAWYKMTRALETVLDEINEFDSQYRVLNKPPLDISAAKLESRQILASCVRMLKTIEKMDDIQRRDMMS